MPPSFVTVATTSINTSAGNESGGSSSSSGPAAAASSSSAPGPAAVGGIPLPAQGDAYWRDPNRLVPYPIPYANDPVWQVINQVVPSPHRQVRILRSRTIKGWVIWTLQEDGLSRLTNYQCLQEFLFWNPFLYFYNHPLINEVWIENEDTDEYSSTTDSTNPSALYTEHSADSDATVDAAEVTASSGSSSSAAAAASSSVPVEDDDDEEEEPEGSNYVLVLRRSELTYAIADGIRGNQADFFRINNIGMHDADTFVGTLHGK